MLPNLPPKELKKWFRKLDKEDKRRYSTEYNRVVNNKPGKKESENLRLPSKETYLKYKEAYDCVICGESLYYNPMFISCNCGKYKESKNNFYKVPIGYYYYLKQSMYYKETEDVLYDVFNDKYVSLSSVEEAIEEHPLPTYYVGE